MTTQPEQVLRNSLLLQLTTLEYAYDHINNEGLYFNMKRTEDYYLLLNKLSLLIGMFVFS